MRSFVLGLVVALAAGAAAPAVAQVPGACEAAADDNVGAAGCYHDGSVDLGAVGEPLYWHIDEFDSLDAAQAAATPTSYADTALGRIFLQTMSDDPGWTPDGGRRIATVGPLPLGEPAERTARFMEAYTTAGMITRPHRHAGPEAWLVLEGGQCLETPAGASMVGAGESAWIEEGPPMQLANDGDGERRALLIVVHRTGEPWMTMAQDWTPTGLCGTMRGDGAH
jgi:quercetin dioxygenase-like cupin family protein